MKTKTALNKKEQKLAAEAAVHLANAKIATELENEITAEHIDITSKKTLETFLEHPEKYLNSTTDSILISQIQKMPKTDKKDLEAILGGDLDIKTTSIGHRILEFFKKLWNEIEPIAKNIVNEIEPIAKNVVIEFTPIVEKIAVDTIGKKVGNTELGNIIQQDTKTVLDNTSKILTQLMDNSNSTSGNTTSATTIVSEIKTTATTIVKDSTPIIQNIVDKKIEQTVQDPNIKQILVENVDKLGATITNSASNTTPVTTTTTVVTVAPTTAPLPTINNDIHLAGDTTTTAEHTDGN